MEKFRTINIDRKFIESNRDIVFNAWTSLWRDSFWEFYCDGDIDYDIPYLLGIVDHGVGYAVFDEDEIVALMFGSTEKFPKALSQEEVNFFKVVRNSYKKIAFLQELVVSPEYRGLGIGSMLCKRFIEYCSDKKFDAIILYTHIDSPSIWLYKQLGFDMVDTFYVTLDYPEGKIEPRSYFVKKIRS
ncbi:GNAT family N-acetyltransferase [Candidatus Dojkabacteria bacterium]|nr:GNAT family N-acetyltransferase [Candidatus Dojkabacteria bacterium]